MGNAVIPPDAALAQLALDTYYRPPTWVGGGDVGNVHLLKDTFPGALMIGARGSAEWRDWALNFTLIPWNVVQVVEAVGVFSILGHVHAGFLHAALSVLGDVEAEVIAAEARGDDVSFAGHSFGGAVVLFLAAMLAARGHKPARVVTFGAPRCGHDSFRTACSGFPVTQYKYGNDVVPQHPLSLLRVADYVEVGEVHVFDPLYCHHMPRYLAGTLARAAANPGGTR